MLNKLKLSALMTGEIYPFSFPPADIVVRARRLLDGKSDWDLQIICEHISLLLADYDRYALDEMRKTMTPERDPDYFIEDTDNSGHVFFTFDAKHAMDACSELTDTTGPTFALEEWLSLKSTPKNDQLDGLCSKYQAFAAVALMYFHKSNFEPAPLDNDHLLIRSTARYLIWSMEALCFAELTANMDTADRARISLERQQQEDRKRRALELNKLRHEHNHKARDIATTEWYKMRSSKDSKINSQSFEKAGQSISVILETKGYKIEQRTVAKWLRTYAKQRGLKP